MKFLTIALLLIAPAAFACETVTVGDLIVEHAWSKATIGVDRPAVLYVEITNTGSSDDALVGIATPAASSSMLHETVVTDGIASMPHAMSIPVPAGKTVELAPGGYHGMLMGLSAALKEGARFPVILTFEKADAATINVDVLSMRSEGPACEHAGQ
ncbi:MULTISPECIES: copper chaperone PCu(A)C [Paracoccaceae]|uniref:Copper chaperone PCu(A)C n=1 Tax=Haematobacter missouriensis TaxID=366616 RepID=A0A212AHF7_9RHOB|nr:copper chaperone PCu(A)C [Haematobacter missouriensis]OWJ80924.1 hypothetical protein CDV52_20540 [Haematobacter missouriensis]